MLRVNVTLPGFGTLNWLKLKKRFGPFGPWRRPRLDGIMKFGPVSEPGVGAVESSVI